MVHPALVEQLARSREDDLRRAARHVPPPPLRRFKRLAKDGHRSRFALTVLWRASTAAPHHA